MNRIKESKILVEYNAINVNKGVMYRTDGVCHYFAKCMLPAGTYNASQIKFSTAYTLSNATQSNETVTPPDLKLGDPTGTAKLRIPTLRGSAIDWFDTTHPMLSDLCVVGGKAYMMSNTRAICVPCDLPDIRIPKEAYMFMTRHLAMPMIVATLYKKHVKLTSGSHEVIFKRIPIEQHGIIASMDKALQSQVHSTITFDPRAVQMFCEKADASNKAQQEGGKQVKVELCVTEGTQVVVNIVTAHYDRTAPMRVGTSTGASTVAIDYRFLNDCAALKPVWSMSKLCAFADLGYGVALVMLMKTN